MLSSTASPNAHHKGELRSMSLKSQIRFLLARNCVILLVKMRVYPQHHLPVSEKVFVVTILRLSSAGMPSNIPAAFAVSLFPPHSRVYCKPTLRPASFSMKARTGTVIRVDQYPLLRFAPPHRHLQAYRALECGGRSRHLCRVPNDRFWETRRKPLMTGIRARSCRRSLPKVFLPLAPPPPKSGPWPNSQLPPD